MIWSLSTLYLYLCALFLSPIFSSSCCHGQAQNAPSPSQRSPCLGNPSWRSVSILSPLSSLSRRRGHRKRSQPCGSCPRRYWRSACRERQGTVLPVVRGGLGPAYQAILRGLPCPGGWGSQTYNSSVSFITRPDAGQGTVRLQCTGNPGQEVALRGGESGPWGSGGAGEDRDILLTLPVLDQHPELLKVLCGVG